MKNRKPLILSIGLALVLAISAPAAAVNLALSGTATQSSDYSGTGVAHKAIDGNTNGNYFAGSVTHTQYEQGAWWQVDLGDMFWLDSIVLWNRTDCCGDRLSDFHVSVFDESMTEIFRENYFTGGGTFPVSMSIDFANDLEGRYVKVQLNGTNWLQLAEVEVYSGAAPVPAPATLLLLGSGLAGLLRLRKKFAR